MGSGKSTAGRLLAERTGRAFVDTDDEIERETGSTVHDLFRSSGETAFRDLEAAAIRRVLGLEGVILATGGGAFVQDDLARELLAGALVVHLACDFDEAFERARNQGGRPLVEKGRFETAGLYAGRKGKYARAHVTVDTTRRSPAEVVDAILDAVQSTQV
jgi:shikimate kinase